MILLRICKSIGVLIKQSSYNAKGDEKQIKDNTVNGYAFSEAFILPTTLEQDTQIRNTFIDAVNDGYGLISNQCAQSVQKALNSAGVETAVTVTRTVTDRQHGDIYQVTTKSNPYLPSTTFNSIIKNNPSGLYIRRR